MEKENQFFATNQRHSSQVLPLREKPRSGLGMQQMQQFRQVVRRGTHVSHKGAAATSGTRPMGDVLDGLKDKGNLGFIAQQVGAYSTVSASGKNTLMLTFIWLYYLNQITVYLASSDLYAALMITAIYTYM